MPDDLKAAADAARGQAGPIRMEALDGQVLLGQAAEVYERAVGLADRLEERLVKDKAVDMRSVVAAFREMRQALETVAKLSFLVQDRPTKQPDSELPELDAAIVQALQARDFSIAAPAQGEDEGRGQHHPAALLPPAE